METGSGRHRFGHHGFNHRHRFNHHRPIIYENNIPSYIETENTNFNIDIDTPEELKVW